MKFSRPFWRTIVGRADFFGRISDTRETRGMFGVFYDLSLEKDDQQNRAPKTAYTFSDLCMDGSVAPAASKGETTAAAPTPAPTTQTTNQIATNTNTKIGNLTTTPSQTSSPLLHSMSAKSAKMTTSKQDSSASESEKGYILVTTVSGEALNEYEKLSDMEIVSKCLTCLRHMFPMEDVPAPSGHVVSRWGADPFAQMSYSYAAVGSTGEDYDYMAQDVAEKIFFAGEVSSQLLFNFCFVMEKIR